MKKTAVWLAVSTLVLWAAGAWAHPRFYEPPILMYHRIEPAGVSEEPTPRVEPAVFEKQMEFLKVHGYRVEALPDLAKEVAAGRKIAPKTVVITFDDGTLDNFRYAFPVLKQMDFPATIFMITDNIGREGWLSEEDLRILDESGVSIGSHTAHHVFLPGADPEAARSELAGSKARLESVLGHPVTLFSYPAGGLTSAVERMVSEAGYGAAVTTNYGRSRADAFALHRIKATDSGGNLFNFWLKVSGYYHLGKKRIVQGE